MKWSREMIFFKHKKLVEKKTANKSYKIVVIAHNKVKLMLINIMIVKDIRFDPIWRYVIPCHFHWPFYEKSRKRAAVQQRQQQKLAMLFMRNKCTVTCTNEPFISMPPHTEKHKQLKYIQRFFFHFSNALTLVCLQRYCIWGELMFCSGRLLILMKLAVSRLHAIYLTSRKSHG